MPSTRRCGRRCSKHSRPKMVTHYQPFVNTTQRTIHHKKTIECTRCWRLNLRLPDNKNQTIRTVYHWSYNTNNQRSVRGSRGILITDIAYVIRRLAPLFSLFGIPNAHCALSSQTLSARRYKMGSVPSLLSSSSSARVPCVTQSFQLAPSLASSSF